MVKNAQWILSLVFGAVLLLGITVIPGFGADGLFSDAGDAQVAALQAGTTKPDPTVVRTRYVKINFDQLRGNLFPDGAGSILLNLYGDLSYSATKGRLEKRSASRYTWFGRVDGAVLSDVILVVEDGIMAGNIMVNGEFYQVRAVGEGIHAVRKIDQSKFPEEAPPIPVQSAPDQSELLSPSPAADDGSTIDVMVVYTGAVASYFSNNLANITANIQLGIDETNQSYANSGITQRVRLVHAAQVNYTETGNSSTDLGRLQNPSDGYLDEVHAMRDTYGADLVSLWVESMDACGIGYLMTNVSTAFASNGFSVVMLSCATGYYSFGHEMGHNMGAHHDRYVTNGEDGAYPYSHGYVNTTNKWRTVMAYDNQCNDNGYSCTRIQYWSNPSVNYQGSPTGISQNASNSANNVLTLNNTAYTVANFRASVAPAPTCDYVIDFYPVSYSGKEIDDGYYSSSIGDSGWELVVCGNYFGNTSDWFSGDIYDNSGYRTTIYGTIIWNKANNPTSAYIQGTAVESGSDLYTFYLDGTLKWSRTKYTFSSKAGETYTNGGSPWIVLLSSFKSTTGHVMDKDAKKDRGAKVGKKGKNIWKKVE